ncbi:carotenoid oxygenase family protein [Streptomyces anulatus]|uniref:carotenoid oxygenase family protein n=1 Tax=Streptomyces anulatus TaxID=1892 RepID=UPI0036297A22
MYSLITWERSWTCVAAAGPKRSTPNLRPSLGAVPQDLAGTLYRNGAGNHLPDYVIDGDGLVSAVTFTPGSPVHVRSRYVRTPPTGLPRKPPGQTRLRSGWPGPTPRAVGPALCCRARPPPRPVPRWR